MENKRNEVIEKSKDLKEGEAASSGLQAIEGDQSSDLQSSPVVPITMAVATRIRQRIENLVVSREAWEMGVYARSNELLYSLIAECYTLYRELTDKSSSTTKDKRRGLDDYISLKAMVFKDDTPLTGKIIRCVFAGTDRRRMSTYHTVLRVAVAQDWQPNEFASNLAKFGGVQEISLSKASGAMTAKQKAEAAKVRVLSQVLATASSDALAKLASTDGIGSKAVDVMSQEADGSFTIHAIVHSDTAVNAALATYFSSHKEELAALDRQVSQEANVATRDELTAAAAQAVANA